VKETGPNPFKDSIPSYELRANENYVRSIIWIVYLRLEYNRPTYEVGDLN